MDRGATYGLDAEAYLGGNVSRPERRPVPVNCRACNDTGKSREGNGAPCTECNWGEFVAWRQRNKRSK